jgi:N-acetylglucosaminyl-diphospho-decaprenol L-rhamnosyltransferase
MEQEVPMTKLAVVILNYRTPALTLACLESLQDQIDADTRVIVVDNASGDGSADRIEQAIALHDLDADVLRSPTNGGFAAGMNFGIKAVPAEAYLLLNSDTIVRPNALMLMREAMRAHPEAGIIGPALIDENDAPAQSCFRDPHPVSELLRAARTGVLQRSLERFELVLPKTSAPMEADWIAFACVLVSRKLIDDIGLLDEGYFMYFEDVDYCHRAREAGWKVLYWPAAEVAHFAGSSSGVSSAKQTKRAPRYYYEARARYYAKWFGREGLWLANALWHVGRGVSFCRERLGRESAVRESEASDIWTNALAPLATAAAQRTEAS